MTAQPVVYRAYDIDGRLLYVGSTGNFKSRMSNHRVTSWWTALASRYDIEVHLDIDSARRAELAAIHSESPAFNTTYNQRRMDEPMPLTANDVLVAREWLARSTSGSAYLPYAMRWIKEAA